MQLHEISHDLVQISDTTSSTHSRNVFYIAHEQWSLLFSLHMQQCFTCVAFLPLQSRAIATGDSHGP